MVLDAFFFLSIFFLGNMPTTCSLICSLVYFSICDVNVSRLIYSQTSPRRTPPRSAAVCQRTAHPLPAAGRLVPAAGLRRRAVRRTDHAGESGSGSADGVEVCEAVAQQALPALCHLSGPGGECAGVGEARGKGYVFVRCHSP